MHKKKKGKSRQPSQTKSVIKEDLSVIQEDEPVTVQPAVNANLNDFLKQEPEFGADFNAKQIESDDSEDVDSAIKQNHRR